MVCVCERFLLFKMAPRQSAKMLARVTEHKKAAMCLTEKKCVLDKLCPGLSVVLLAVSSMLMYQQYIPNKVSLMSNKVSLMSMASEASVPEFKKFRTRLCIDQLTKMLCLEACRDLTPYFFSKRCFTVP